MAMVSWCACVVMLPLWCWSAGVLVHGGTRGVSEVSMVEAAVSAGRCTLVPRGFGSWSPPVYECFDAGMGIT